MTNSFCRADYYAFLRPITVALLFVLVLSVSRSAYGQWTTSGNNINNTNTDNVGIGTATPGAKLDIRAGSAARGANSDLLLGGGPEGVPQLELFGTSNSSVIQLDSTGLFFWTNGPSWRSSLFLGNNGNVGVGTTSPANLFHVNNPTGAGSLLVSGSGLGLVNIQDFAGPANAKLFQWRSEGGVVRLASINDAWSGFVQQNIFVAGATGNIGVGTSNPTALQGGLTGLTGRVFQIQNSSGPAHLAISSSGVGNVAILGFEVGDATASRRYFQQLFDGTSNVLKFRALNEGTGAVTQDNILTLKNTGNVGIGTAGPNFRLDVQGGRINSADGLCINGDCKISWSEVGSSQWANTSATSINYANGNVGIGIAGPNFRLDVQGGRINSSDGLCINGDCKTSWSQVGSSQWANTSATTINYANGNVGIATPAPSEKLHVTGNVKVIGSIDVSGNINAKYQDVAEWVESSQELSAGTVVVLDDTKSNQVVASTKAYDGRVAGVISLKPGIALGERGEGHVLVATTGRVKVKVDASSGPIKIGDLLVTSDKEGVAMKSVPIEVGGARIHRPGTLIGKALEPLAAGTGEILVLLSLQ